MNEQLLQFIWKFQYFNPSGLCDANGEQVQIITPGNLNTNQGPDFSDARIKIGKTLWVGTVELHVKSSDWNKHGHSKDGNYKNVILHVVYENDCTIENVPLIELKTRISANLLRRYNRLMASQQFIACESLIEKVPELTIALWKERLIIERLIRKTTAISKYLEQNKQHWEESFWWLLARSFGTRANADAFEAMAKSIPVTLLAKHKKQLIQLEALLLGQAGLLTGIELGDKYAVMLQKEYHFLQSKYRLKPVTFPVYFLRMRPGNFPTVRLAQLAALVFNSAHLFSKIVEEPSLNVVKKCFGTSPNDFWNYHYTLTDEARFRPKPIGADMINNIVVNTICPMLFSYGQAHQNQELKDKALQWLEEALPEVNAVTRGFQRLNLPNKSAWDSQALIELKTQYCNNKKCLYCAIGNAIIKH